MVMCKENDITAQTSLVQRALQVNCVRSCDAWRLSARRYRSADGQLNSGAKNHQIANSDSL